MIVLGLDIGGANLKAAHTSGRASSVPFALWKNLAGLSDALRRLLDDMPPTQTLAVTMTGELCDCFESKRQGVHAILNAVAAVAGATPVRVWRNDGRFVDISAARAEPLPAASANWLALAAFAGRYAPQGPALLLDIGSTTTDIVPLLDGQPAPRGRTDYERRCFSELVYTGVRRTPLCALLGSFGAAELFATTRDVYLLLGLLPEDAADYDTADGRPATKAAAELRIARMVYKDLETSTAAQRLSVAHTVWLRQVGTIALYVGNVVSAMPAPPQTVLVAGEGEFLIKEILDRQKGVPPCRVVSLSAELDPAISRAACAYAVAMLAAEKG